MFSEQLLMQLGAGGLIVLLVLREVFGFLKTRKLGVSSDHLLKDILEELKEQRIQMSEVLAKTKTLYHWHDKEDNDGIKIWYVRSSLENAIEKLAENISKQTDILQQMFAEQKFTRNEIKRLEHEIRDRTS